MFHHLVQIFSMTWPAVYIHRAIMCDYVGNMTWESGRDVCNRIGSFHYVILASGACWSGKPQFPMAYDARAIFPKYCIPEVDVEKCRVCAVCRQDL